MPMGEYSRADLNAVYGVEGNMGTLKNDIDPSCIRVALRGQMSAPIRN